MRYTIRKTDAGWELVAADGTVIAAFTGPEEQSYHDTIAHLSEIITRERAEVAVAGAVAEGDQSEEGLLPERWTSAGMGIAFQEKLPGGRDFSECAWSWRDPTTGLVPLMLQTANEGGHWGAELAGFAEEFSLSNLGQVDSNGRFYDNDAGKTARDLLGGGRVFGVSVDPSEKLDYEENFECTEYLDDECIDGEWSVAFHAYEIAGLTMVPFPGFEDAAIKLAASRRTMFLRDGGAIRLEGTEPMTMLGTTGLVTTGRLEVHSAFSLQPATLSVPLAPPRGWFEMPEPTLGQPFGDGLGDDVLVPQGDSGVLACPPTFLDTGQAYGHLTYWGQCHVGSPWGQNRCASASRSSNGYADFHGAGHVICDDGSELDTGLLHVGCEHSTAMDVRGVRDAAAHAGLAFAQVRVVDGEYGPWFCGSLLPTVTDAQLVKLRALTLSGEWAPELGAVIAVNDGGLPLQRKMRIAASNGSELVVADRKLVASVRSGQLAKLVGGNPVRRCPECARRAAVAREQISSTARLEALVAEALAGIDRIDRRTRHLLPAEAEATRASLAASNGGAT